MKRRRPLPPPGPAKSARKPRLKPPVRVVRRDHLFEALREELGL